MLRTKPSIPYCGLTIILSNPSRFDNNKLLSAGAGHLINDYCLRPEFNVMQCDIRLADEPSAFLEGTKCLLLLGEYAMHKYCVTSRNNTLNEMRGSPLVGPNNIPCIASYFPQDAVDMVNHEGHLNKESHTYEGDEAEEDEDEEGDEKTLGRTKRSNYAFWLLSDIKKCKFILRNGLPTRKVPNYIIWPKAKDVIEILRDTKNQTLLYDKETDYEEQNLLCFSFSFDGRNIFSVPILDFNYKLAYGNDTYRIIAGLSVGVANNLLVAHNGHSFDFFVLAFKYGIPVKKCYDTMIAQHRIYPDIEKSLGHCTSLWTWEVFHKDIDSRAYRTKEHMIQKLEYCAKDVYTMYLIKQAQDAYAKTIPGLQESIKVANDSIRPYLTCSMQGIRFSQEKVDKLKKENDRLMMQYIRIINILVGSFALEDCRKQIKGGKPKSFPGSNTQCVHYFHVLLGYPVLWRSKKTQKPSLGATIMYKLRLKYPDNPVITMVLLYRSLAKEYGTLKFNSFKDDNNKIIQRVRESETTFSGGHSKDLFGGIKAISPFS